MSNIPLILFAKAPIAGQVKTRLSTHCTDQQCADIAEILLEITVQKAIKYWPGRVILSVFLDPSHVFLKSLRERYELELSLQVEGDLGFKMASALDQHGYPAAVMGCDVPQISAELLQYAHNILEKGGEVIGPAEDGGFYLLGAKQSNQELLSKQKWGEQSVYLDTMKLAAKQRRELIPMDRLRDIDNWQDLVTVSNQISELKSYLKGQGLLV